MNEGCHMIPNCSKPRRRVLEPFRKTNAMFNEHATPGSFKVPWMPSMLKQKPSNEVTWEHLICRVPSTSVGVNGCPSPRDGRFERCSRATWGSKESFMSKIKKMCFFIPLRNWGSIPCEQHFIVSYSQGDVSSVIIDIFGRIRWEIFGKLFCFS